MAIYKPTNCTPFLTTFDCRIQADDEPVFFECRIDSSNRNAVGYSVTVYDENNDQVFPPDGSAPEDHISKVSYLKDFTGRGQNGTIPYLIQNSGYNRLNSGLNGTYIKFPFILNIEERDSFKSTNTVYYDQNSSSLRWFNSDSNDGNDVEVLMYNGNTYKWVITLYQGDDQGNTPPLFTENAYKYYDMQLTMGEVMGSYSERIQTIYSENVYIDYYIEPIKIAVPLDAPSGANTPPDLSNPTNWSLNNGKIIQTWTRTRIKNIDPTYGYLYPQIDDYSYEPSAIMRGQANAYRIYQMGNDPEVLSTTRKVDKAVQIGLPLDWHNLSSDGSSSYGQITFYTITSADQGQPNSPELPDGATIQNGTMSSTSFYPWYLIALTTYEVTKNSDGEDQYSSTPVIRWFCTQRANGIGVDERIVLAFQPSATGEYYGNVDIADTERPFIPSAGLTTQEITNNATNDSVWGGASAYNGIYSTRFSDDGEIRFSFVAPTEEEPTPTIYSFNTYTISWDRTSDAATWGDLSTKIVMVQNYYHADENIQTDIREPDGTINNGILNQTPFSFIAERPIQLYSYADEDFTDKNNILKNNTGVIFYNGGEWAGNENATQTEIDSAAQNKLYISPFVGIKPGMYWIEQGNKSANEKRRFIIKEINNNYWYVTYDDYNGGNSTGTYPASFTRPERQTPYVIKSYFRDSDENPFDLYENPTIDIKVYRDEGHTCPNPIPNLPNTDIPYFDSEGEYVAEQNYGASDAIKMTCVDRRIIWCEADYNQADFISWRSFQWFLYDGIGTSGTLLQSSDLTFDGKLGHQFYGLLLNKVYTVVLVLETNSGLTLSQQKYISTNFQTVEVDNFPFDITYECETHSVYLRFGLSGFILPNVYSESATKPRIQEEDGSNTDPLIDGVTYDGANMIIDGTDSGFPDTGVTYSYICSTLDDNMGTTQIQADEDDVSFESSHKLVVGDGWGNIIGFDFTEDELDFGDGYESFNIFIPDYNSGSFEYNGETYSYVDETRVHQILFENTAGQIVLEASIYDWTGSLISSKGIFDADEEGNASSPIVVSGHFQTGGEVDGYSGNNVIFKENYPSILITMDEGETSTYFTPRNGAPHQYRESYFDFLGKDDAEDDAENVNALPPLVAAENVKWVDFLVLTVPGGSAREGFNVKDQTGGSEVFQVIGTGPHIWSDYNLVRKNVAYSGSVSINAQTFEKTFNVATYVNRQVEDLESDWIWSDGTYTDSEDVSGGNYEPDFYWVDGDDGGQLDGLYSQTDLTTSNSASLRNSANIEKYTYSIRAVVEGNYSGTPNITVQIFKQLFEGAD